MEFVPCWNMIIVGISVLYLVYVNAPIYLVKGGRLGVGVKNGGSRVGGPELCV